MDDSIVALYGPRNRYGVPAWEVRRDGERWVFAYRGGPVHQTFGDVGEAVRFARSWHDEARQRAGR